MDLCAHKQKVDSIKELINKKISNDYLLQHFEGPAIDDDRIHMLTMAVGDSETFNESHQFHIASAMLVQIALDTHDLVSNDLDSLKAQQLHVLGGDYFSGLYYQLLAEVENIHLIRTLAHSIKLINEHKIAVYQLESDDIYSFIESVKIVEANIVEQFCLHFHAVPYCGLFAEFLLLKKLLVEKKKFNNGQFSILFNGLKHYSLKHATSVQLNELSCNDKQALNDICDSYIEKSKNILKSKERYSKLPFIFQSRIDQLANSYKGIAT